MLAQLNVVILSVWLIAEIVPLVADRAGAPPVG
jgi:hypothetical protein